MNWNLLKLRIVRPPDRAARLVLELLEDRRLLSSNVLSFHNDLLRTGDNLTESILTPANVQPGSFGQRFSYPVDGQVYAQPLYVANVTLPDGSVHNIVYVATEHDSLYAFDADDPTTGGNGVLWHTSYIDPANGINPASSTDIRCGQIAPEVGITDTPAIDPNTGIMYFVTETEDTSGGTPVYHQTAHAVDITTGNDVLPPVDIQAAVLGQGDANFGSPNVVRFQPGSVKERAGVLLLNGIVYFSFASNCDISPTHGWILGYDSQSLTQVAVFNTSPNGQIATIWGGGGAPAADANGNIFVLTGNGAFSGGDFNQGLATYPETVLKLSTVGGEPQVVDSFTPYNWSALDQRDEDFGSGQVMMLPDQPGAIPHLLVAAGKEGKIYLLNRDNLGGYNGLYDNVVQEIPNALAGGGSYSVAAYFSAGAPNQRWIYYAAQGDTLKAFQLSDEGRLSSTPTSQSSHVFTSVHGATASVSANGTSNGIVWITDPNPAGAVLYAYDATDLTNELYDSSMNPADQLDAGVKFSVPTIADGQVFVGTADTLSVFGLLPGGARSGRKVHAVPTGQVLAAGDLQAVAGTLDGLQLRGGMAPLQIPSTGAVVPTTGALAGEMTALAWLNLGLAGQNARPLDTNQVPLTPPDTPTSLVDGVDGFFQTMTQLDHLA